MECLEESSACQEWSRFGKLEACQRLWRPGKVMPVGCHAFAGPWVGERSFPSHRESMFSPRKDMLSRWDLKVACPRKAAAKAWHPADITFPGCYSRGLSASDTPGQREDKAPRTPAGVPAKGRWCGWHPCRDAALFLLL